MSEELQDNQFQLNTRFGPVIVTVRRDTIVIRAEGIVVNGVEYTANLWVEWQAQAGRWQFRHLDMRRPDWGVATDKAREFMYREVLDAAVKHIEGNPSLTRVGELASIRDEIESLSGERGRLLERVVKLEEEIEVLHQRETALDGQE